MFYSTDSAHESDKRGVVTPGILATLLINRVCVDVIIEK